MNRKRRENGKVQEKVKGKERAAGKVLQREWKRGYLFRFMKSLKHPKYLSQGV